VAFVVVWLIGDIFNLTGAVIAGLLPTIIILAAYVSNFPNVLSLLKGLIIRLPSTLPATSYCSSKSTTTEGNVLCRNLRAHYQDLTVEMNGPH
jgi:hypothetical protein